jgi:hypothetical protein
MTEWEESPNTRLMVFADQTIKAIANSDQDKKNDQSILENFYHFSKLGQVQQKIYHR